MAEDNTQQSITICSPQSYRIEFNDRIEYVKQHTTLYSPEQIESMVPDFILKIEQEVQNENHHHVCESIDLGQEYDENGKMKHQNLKQIKVKFMRKSKCPHVISFFVDEVEGKKTATLQHILHGLQIQHRVAKESTRHWILLPEFVNRNTMRNKTMKRTYRITNVAEQFKEIIQHGTYPSTKRISGYVILQKNLDSEDEWIDWGFLFDTEESASEYLNDYLDEDADIENYDIVKVSFTLIKDFA